MIIDPYTWHRLTVKSITRITGDTVAVGLNRPPAYTFRAGQYAVVRITTADKRQFIRQYSYSSGPQEKSLELLIQREPNGEVSRWFHDTASAGDSIEVSQALGSFTLEPRVTRPILLIAGRIGVAPYISMLRNKRRRGINLLYSVRSIDQVCFPELLRAIPTTIIATDTSPRINIATLEPVLRPKPIVYVCGSKQFVDAICELLSASGVEPGDVHRELFTLQ
jgi:ferredoxin-NADP reductase